MKPWEKLGVTCILGVGMPSGVYMLNELMEWRFKRSLRFEGSQYVTRVNGTFFNETVNLAVKHERHDQHAAVSRDLERVIRHSWVGNFIWKLKSRPRYENEP